MTLNENGGFFDGMDGSNIVNGSATRSVDATNGFKKSDGNSLMRPPSPSPVAVVGMACRFAGGVTSPEKLWDLCSSGRDAWSQIPETRFNLESVTVPSSEGASRNHTTGGYFLQQDLASFDAAFFGLTSEEASAMDPQLRMLLEVVYEATENAGFPIDKLAGPGPNTSVFVASSNQDYRDLQMRDPETIPASVSTATAPVMLSSRISQFYDFWGASMSLDAGDPGALTALHEGCQTIRSGQSRVCIIGASNAILNPDWYIQTYMNSPVMVGSSRCSDDWESGWQAYNLGEGVAALILKPLDAAFRDGDKVHAVIRNSGLNQNGKTTNIEHPSLPAQTRLIQECYRSAGLDLSQTAYIEAQMTGAQGWNATEAKSFAETFGMSRGANEPVWVGAVTTNVGYTGAVGGLAGIIKAAMAMKHRSIPPSLNYAVGNAEMALEGWRLRVPTSLVPWPSSKPLRASINSFGRSGTNAHVILEAAPENTTNGEYPREDAATGDDDGFRVYVLSAQSQPALESMGKNLASHLNQLLQSGNTPSPAVLAHTLSSRRSRLSHITTIRAQSLQFLTQHLATAATLHVSQPPTTTAIPRIGFVFNGQGAQWHAMGRELLIAYPVFKAAVHYADTIIRYDYGADWSLLEELSRDAETTRVFEMHLGQPVTVALQLCLVVLLREWGVRPMAVTSHSSGEIAAAYAVGALSFRQALGVAYWQGALARDLLDRKQSGLAGGMAAGGVGVEEAEGYVADTKSGGKVVVACVNSSESVTFAGDVDDLDEVVARLEAAGKFGRRINVPVAYHSHHMLRLANAYTEKLRGIVPTKPAWSGSVTYTSPVTGGLITTPDELTAEHYVNNLTRPVLFNQAFEAMCFGADRNSPGQVNAIVEIGPHSTLNGPIHQILDGRAMTYSSCLKRNSDAVSTMQDLAATLLHLRYPVDLDAVNRCTSPAERRPFVHDLPAYPWDHDNSYWIEPRISRETRFGGFSPHEILGTSVPGATTPSWRNFFRLIDLPWVGDHRVNGDAVLPAAAYVCMAIEAAKKLASKGLEAGGIKWYSLRNVEFLHPLIVPETGVGVETQLCLRPKRDQVGWYEFDVRSLEANGAWVENCCGMVGLEGLQGHDETTTPNADLFLNNTVRHMDKKALQSQIAAKTGIEYGPTFQGLSNGRVSVAANRAVADLQIQGPKIDSGATSYVIHPTTLDCIMQAICICLPRSSGKKSFVVPRSLQAITVCDRPFPEAENSVVVLSELYNLNRRGFKSRVRVVDETLPTHSEQAQLTLEGLFCQTIPRPPSPSGDSVLLSTTRWEPDVLHSIPNTIRNTMCITLTDRELDLERKLDRASYHLIADAVSVLENQNPALNADTWAPRQRAIFEWMKTIVAKGQSGQLAAGSRVWAKVTKGVKRMLFDDLKSGAGTYGDLLVKVGSALAGIVNGDATTGELLRQYENGVSLPPRLETRSFKQLAKLVQLFAVKNPGARVLEIGTGTGVGTLVVLEAFAPQTDGRSLIGDYIATNPDSRTFEAARKRIGSLADMVQFRELNIAKQDPVVAGFAEHSFDLVVATLAMQGTGDHGKVLGNIRKLLAPAGKLILLGPTPNRLDTQLLFSVLVDRDKNDADHPAQPIEFQQLDGLLRTNGFTGADFDIRDCEQLQYQGSRVILTSVAVLNDAKNAADPAISIVIPSSPESTRGWITALTETIRTEIGITAAAESLEDVEPSNERVYILTDLRDSNTGIDTFYPQNLDKIRCLLTMNSGILWLTSDGEASDAPLPGTALIQGLLTTLRQAETTKPYMLLNLPRDWTTNISSVVGHIVEVLKRTVVCKDCGSGSVDWEYTVKDSVLKVPRVYPAHHGSKKDGNEFKSLQPFHKPGRALVWDASAEDAFVEDPLTKSIPDDMVEIRTVAFSADPFGHQGDDGKTHGLHEVAGIITNVGLHAVGEGFQVGDNVCALVKDSFASTVRAVWTSVAKVPESISLRDAACIPLTYSTTYYALVHVARLQKDEKVLILQAANSQEAQAAIAVARHIGAQLLFAPSTEAGSKLPVTKFDPLTSQVFQNWGGGATIQAITGKTGFKGVDVVITTRSARLSGSRLWSALESVGRFGRWVEIGDSSKGPSTDVAALITRCITYSYVDPFQLVEHNGQVMREVLGASLGIINHGDYSPPPNLRQFSASELDKALELVHQQRQSGGGSKVIIVPQVDEQVNVRRGARPHSLDDENATYLIVGEVLCADIASWMASEGAKNVVVVSSNAEAHIEAALLTEEAAAQGCRLRFANCNVSDEEGLLTLLSQLSASFPPIRGVVHVGPNPDPESLETSSGPNSYPQWQRAAGDNIAGVANLHKLVPEKTLSFFVLFSLSTNVAGYASQVNDAAVSAFEGALARHRVFRGFAAASLVLPIITGLTPSNPGVSAEGVDLQQPGEDPSTQSVSLENLVELLGAAIRRQQTNGRSVADAQTIVGLLPWDRLPAKARERRDSRFGTLRLASSSPKSSTAMPSRPTSQDPTTLLLRAIDGTSGAITEQVTGAVAEALGARLAAILNLSAESVDVDMAVAAQGVDSMVAVEVRNWLASAIGVKLSVSDVLRSPSLKGLAGLVVAKTIQEPRIEKKGSVVFPS